MVGLKDIAKECGVSIKTVSNVVNNFPNVREATRSNVKEAIKRLGYVPSGAARNLVLGLEAESPARFHPGRNIACVLRNEVEKCHDSYFSAIFMGIEKEIRKAGHFLLFAESYEDLENSPILMNALLNPKAIDGIITFVGPDKEFVFNRLKSLLIPLVSVGKAEGVESVIIDKEQGIRLALSRLKELGHSKVGFLGGTGRSQGRFDARYSTFLSETAALELIAERSWQIGEGFGFDEGYAAAKRLMECGSLPTAIVCVSDMTAIGAMHAFYENGVAAPKDISVVGFDNVPESESIYPKLTTIDVDKKGLGAAAVRSLLHLIENPDAAVSTKVMPVSLVERDSTSPAPRR